MTVNIKTWIRRGLLRYGVRLTRTSRHGIDWIDDCLCISRERWHRAPGSIEIVFDVGANTGETALELQRRLRPRQIYSFEPVWNTFQQLQANIEGTKSIAGFNYGLSGLNGPAEINIYESSLLASTVDDTPIMSKTNAGFRKREEISLRTVDSVVEELGIAGIDLLKIDTEGADLKVLQGAAKSLSRKAIGFILFEFYQASSPLHESGTLMPIDALLTANGYRLVTFYTDFVNPRQPTGIYNALYMPC